MREIRKDSEWACLISPAAEDDISCIPNICSAEMSVICITLHRTCQMLWNTLYLLSWKLQYQCRWWCHGDAAVVAGVWPRPHQHYISYSSTVPLFQNRTHFHNEWMGFKIDAIWNAKKSNLLSVIHLFVKAKVSYIHSYIHTYIHTFILVLNKV